MKHKYYEWFEWFAWRPVRLQCGKWIWFKKVQKMKTPFYDWDDGIRDGLNEYRIFEVK